MTAPAPALAWTSPAWQARVHLWIRSSLDSLGLTLTGEIEQPHIRPWSTVMKAPTDGGTVYFKASEPALGHETALTRALYRWYPDCMVRVLAAEPEEHWLLLADEGEMLRTRIHSPADLYHWETLLPRYAALQIELSARQEELLALGVLDRRLEKLPGLYSGLLSRRESLRIGEEDGLSEGQYARLVSLEPRFAEMCRRLGETPIPHSLHHDDFHDGNVFIRGGRYAFSDWGESCLAYPFFSLLVNLRSTAYRLGLPDEVTGSPERFTPELARLRDLYLEPWTAFAPLDDLRRAFSLAWRVGMVNRALTWDLAIHSLDAQTQREYGAAVAAWLEEFLGVSDW